MGDSGGPAAGSVEGWVYMPGHLCGRSWVWVRVWVCEPAAPFPRRRMRQRRAGLRLVVQPAGCVPAWRGVVAGLSMRSSCVHAAAVSKRCGRPAKGRFVDWWLVWSLPGRGMRHAGLLELLERGVASGVLVGGWRVCLSAMPACCCWLAA